MRHVKLEFAERDDLGQLVKIASEACEKFFRAPFCIEPESWALHRRAAWTACLRASVSLSSEQSIKCCKNAREYFQVVSVVCSMCSLIVLIKSHLLQSKMLLE
jgi:hypothetical protein